MSDNPFAEPEDSDRTVVRGPQRATQPLAAAAPAVAPSPAAAAPGGFAPPPLPMAGEAEAIPKVGMGPLAAAAAPLLDLLARMAAGVHVSDPGEVRERAARGLRAFEADAREAGASPDELRAAHYALCAALDDVALSTPWGQGSVWSTRSLVSTFHQEVKAGDRFFDMLGATQKDPGRYRQSLEICYLCLALGFQGRYRLSRTGAAELDRIREGLYGLLSQIRGRWERELSPHWRGGCTAHPVGRGGNPPPVFPPLALGVLPFGTSYFSLPPPPPPHHPLPPLPAPHPRAGADPGCRFCFVLDRPAHRPGHLFRRPRGAAAGAGAAHPGGRPAAAARTAAAATAAGGPPAAA